MKINIIDISNKSSSFFDSTEEYYKKQFPKNLSIESIHIKPATYSYRSIEDQLRNEALLIDKQINTKDFLIICSPEGKKFDSDGFSNLIFKIFEDSIKDITFVIGGSRGIDQSIKDKSNLILSFSDLTFPHKLFKLMLVEQIYRAYTIRNNLPYHK